jgi:hypothetical protein
LCYSLTAPSRRKVRCTGTQPCDYCYREDVRCEYEDAIAGPHPPTSRQSQDESPSRQSVQRDRVGDRVPHARSDDGDVLAGDFLMHPQATSGAPNPRIPRRASLEEPQTFAEEQHIGSTSGVSFLYHVWNRGEANDRDTMVPPAPLTCHGDIAQNTTRYEHPLPTGDDAAALLEGYFRFAMPTYRFLHRPTVEGWMAQLLDGRRLSMAKTACTLIVCAQSLLFSTNGDRYRGGGDKDLNRSRFCKQELSLYLFLCASPG